MRKITKNLACAEDLFDGVGKVNQNRNGHNLLLSRINPTEIQGALVVDTFSDMLNLDIDDLGSTKTVIVNKGTDAGLFYYDENKILPGSGYDVHDGWVRSSLPFDGSSSSSDTKFLIDTSIINQADENIENSIAYFAKHNPTDTLILDGIAKFIDDYTITNDIESTKNAFFDNLDGILTFTGKLTAYPQYLFNSIPFMNGNTEVYIDWIIEDTMGENSLICNYFLDKLGGTVDVLAKADIRVGGRLSLKQSNKTLKGINFVYVESPIEPGVSKGGVRIRGEVASTEHGCTLVKDANAGDTVIHLSQSSLTIMPGYTFARLRGENGADGVALLWEDVYIENYDPDTREATLRKPLVNTFYTTYPDSAYTPPPPNSGIDRTTVTPVLASSVVYPVNHRDTLVTVLDTSFFEVGDMISLISDVQFDEKYEYISRQNNSPIHQFYTMITNIDSDKSVIEIAHPAPEYIFIDPEDSASIYDSTTATLRITKIEPIINSHIVDCTAKYIGIPGGRLTDHAFQIVLCKDVSIRNCYVDGRLGQKGHGFSLRQGINLVAVDTENYMPQNGNGGEGYGISLYSCTSSTIDRHISINTRHAVLFFKTACYNLVTNIRCINTAISAIDFHGGASNYNVVKGVLITTGGKACHKGGFSNIYNNTGEYNKAGIKFGNPYHVHGDSYNLVTDVTFIGTSNKYYDQILLETDDSGDYVFNRAPSELYIDETTDLAYTHEGDVPDGHDYFVYEGPTDNGIHYCNGGTGNRVTNSRFYNVGSCVHSDTGSYLVSPRASQDILVSDCIFEDSLSFILENRFKLESKAIFTNCEFKNMYQGAYIKNTNNDDSSSVDFIGCVVSDYVNPDASLVYAESQNSSLLIGNTLSNGRVLRTHYEGDTYTKLLNNNFVNTPQEILNLSDDGTVHVTADEQSTTDTTI